MNNPPIIGTMCMLADRYPRSWPCVFSLKRQVDVLYLCLNNFRQVPPGLQQDWIKILHLGKNLGDAARFYLLKDLDLANGHIVSCDDDIVYPATYVKDFLDAHEKYPDALLTHNGMVFNFQYHSSLPVYHDGVVRDNYNVQFWAENCQTSYLDVGGAGVSFIPKLIFEQFSFNSLIHLNKADIHLACNAKKLGVPIIGLPHPKNYFHPIHHPNPNSLSRLVSSNPKLSRERTRKIYASYGLDFDDPAIPS